MNPHPQDDPILEHVRQADLAWRSAKVARLEAIREAHDLGFGYLRIARACGVSKPMIQQICNGTRKSPAISRELARWRETAEVEAEHVRYQRR